MTYVTQIRIASRCWQVAARVRFYAQELVSLPPGSTEAQYNAARAPLRQFTTALLTQYNAVMYGDSALGVPNSMLTNDARDHLLFHRACLAVRGCVDPSHPWHARVTSGLDTLITYFALEAQYLAEEPSAALTAANPHFDFVWEVGGSDLNDALLRFTEIFNEDTRTNPLAVRNAARAARGGKGVA